MKNNISYTDAVEELETIVNGIENADISVDELSEKVKRAAFLIKLCREKLTKTEKDIQDILEEENDPSPL